MNHFTRKISRYETLLDILKYPMRHILLKLGRHYLNTNGVQIAVYAYDYIGQHICIDGYYEIRELQLIKDWITANHRDAYHGTFLDVGANIGNHTVFFSKLFAKVRSFEPNPSAYRLLSVNTVNLKNVEIFDFGLSDNNGKSDFYGGDRDLGSASLELNSQLQKIDIYLKRMDDLELGNDPISFVKIDVEGHEASVIAGGEKTLKRHFPIVAFEQSEKDFSNGKSATIELLKQFGYNKFLQIQSPPALSSWVPFKNIVTILYKIIFGVEKRLIETEYFNTGFYSLIIALKSDC